MTNSPMDIYKGIVFFHTAAPAIVFYDTKLFIHFRLDLKSLRQRIQNLTFINDKKEYLYDLSNEFAAEHDLIHAMMGNRDMILLYIEP